MLITRISDDSPRASASRSDTPNVDAALANLLADGELGIQVAAYLHGEHVLDATAGRVSASGSEVTPDTVFFAASAGKASTATLLHRQVARGLVDYAQPIRSIWPEFAAEGKGALTVRDALTHRVGLADVAPAALQGEWDDVVGRLALATPSADPAAHDAYHAFTWGYVVGEIARRVDPGERSFPDLVRAEVHEPLGVDELWHALPASEHTRTATVTGDILRGAPFDLVVTEDHLFNTPAHREHLDPSGAWMTARAGARLWSMYAQLGQREDQVFLSPDVVRSFLEPRASAHPAGILVGGRGIIGQGGLMLGGAVDDHERVLGFGNQVLWHPGAGGALGFADLATGVAGMICHTRLFDERSMPRHPFASLIHAISADVLA